MSKWRSGDRHAAAYPIRDEQGRPAWQGIDVIEPDQILWRCPHAHLVDPDNKAQSHDEAVACAQRSGGESDARQGS